jgi:hypothetical protein
MEKKSYFFIGILSVLISVIFALSRIFSLFDLYVLVKEKGFSHFLYNLLYEIISPIGIFTILVFISGLYYMITSIKELETNKLIASSAIFTLISDILIVIGYLVVKITCNNADALCVMNGAIFWLLGLFSMFIAFILLFAGKIRNAVTRYSIIGVLIGAIIGSFAKFDYINSILDFGLYLVIPAIVGGIIGFGIGWIIRKKQHILGWTLIGLIFGFLWAYFALPKKIWYLSITAGVIMGLIIGSLIYIFSRKQTKKSIKK